ncbi:MAG: hypothetical protein JO209_11140 [Acidisphaera sp.]|nr:hypothetical protein [Acidisphaera sp.]
MRSPPSAKSSTRAERAGLEQSAYDVGVFINCRFDESYQPLFDAIVFSALDCGFDPRCAKQIYDSGQVRIDKIMKLIEGCRYGIHDISRTELDRQNGLPRFNMPFELGIFLGAQRFGAGRHRNKSCLVLDREPYRYQKFISDIAGQDVSSHDGKTGKLIGIVRDWLSTVTGGKLLPGGARIAARFSQFTAELPAIAEAFHLKQDELTFSNYANFASEWLRVTAGDSLT